MEICSLVGTLGAGGHLHIVLGHRAKCIFLLTIVKELLIIRFGKSVAWSVCRSVIMFKNGERSM